MDITSMRKEIGSRVTYIRERIVHMTKNDFAKAIKMKSQYLGAVESGKKGLTVEKTIEICNLANVSCDYLLRGLEDNSKLKMVLSRHEDRDIDLAISVIKELAETLK